LLGDIRKEKFDERGAVSCRILAPLVVLRRDLNKFNFVRCAADSKVWANGLPTVDEARPSACPACDVASRPVGGKIMLHGHGSKERQQRGPLTAGGEPVVSVIRVRCYRCQACGAVVRSAPSTVWYRRLYSAAAIGFALALWGVLGVTVAEVRAAVGPWKIIGNSAPERWPTLRRWADAVRRQTLFSSVRCCPDHFTLKQVAERAAMTLASLGDSAMSGGDIAAQAFVGAAHAR
jgi:hypothetical protein